MNDDPITRRDVNGKVWYVVAQAASLTAAEIPAGLLRTAGIPVMLFREAAGSTAIPLTIGPLGGVEVAVPEEWYGEALALLRDDEDDSPPFSIGTLFSLS